MDTITNLLVAYIRGISSEELLASQEVLSYFEPVREVLHGEHVSFFHLTNSAALLLCQR